ncbi:MAG: hypothetical protein IPK94_04400 [Saprospiraceae bacterium]|jgi:hypothetical protein|nr:hypothetical protein [Saprospiraceae bacterium]MBK7436614.1 hypothetical protein [Saprospiraceae bacterium]MBK7609350.1 hypothetical protein [Saprospiraceae bacterium]MBK8279416.1 hypothetical protein [Saprospiraceae bacterium]MBK8511387.1 hypothetical protein [Saprospiraceae bacterium]
MSQIGEEIKKLLEEHQSLKKSEARLAEIVPEIEKVNREVQTLEQQMRKEFEDIENLEKLGMKALFYKVLGSQEEQLEKERQEYLQASLKYDQVRKNLELLEFEYNILKKKSGNLATIEQKLNDLSVRQEKELINMPGAAALEIKKIYLQIDQQERLKIDISEAIKAGLKALECIDAVIAGLQQAHNWGQWDVSGRNPMSNHLKYSAIDKAKDWAYESNRQLKVFEKELLDVYKQIPEDFQLHIDSFNRFIDVFFDNLITDWIIQQKIYNALNNTLNIRDKVVRMIKTLEGENPKVAQTISTLEQRKKEFILSNTV